MAACATCGAELPGGARFCPACGAPVEEAPPGEMLKLVTVLFADVVGSTARGEALHPEEARALMADFFAAMSEEIRAEGGTIEKYVGDAIMAVFGVPAAHEDDPVRAVRAARRMLDRLAYWNEGREAAERLEIRLGVNTGDVIAAGSPGRDLLVTGDAVNVAARLQQSAEPGQIVVGERTARAVGRLVDLRPIEPITAKGKTEPIAAWAVEGEIAAAELRGIPGLPTPLVGRNRELDVLQTTFARVSGERSPSLVTVLGDAGVGKSRLVREFVGSLEVETKVAFGRCLSYGEGVTLWPLGEILKSEAMVLENDPHGVAVEKIRALVEQAVPAGLAPDREGTAAALASTIGFRPARADPREAYRALLAAWRALLAGLAAAQPLVVIVEDLHWADPTMLEVLDDLAEHAEGPLLFLCTARPDLLRTRPDWGGGKRNYSSLPLDRLDPDESARLVSSLLDIEELPPDVKSRILERAEGNPFFLEEIVRRLIDEGLLVNEEGRWRAQAEIRDVEIPDNVQAVILARIDLLSPSERRALQQAAVVGRTFWSGVVARLAGDEDLEETLRTLCRRELLLERLSSSMGGETEFIFKHILIRDVAYESLPRRDRAQAHAEAAAWIEDVSGERASDFAELLAHHYDVAWSLTQDDQLREQARSCYLAAGRAALRRFAIAQSQRFGQRAVELSSGLGRIEALEALGDLYELTLQGDGAWKAYTDALAEVENDPAELGRLAAKATVTATRWFGTLHAHPPVEEVERLIERGLQTVGETDSRERALLLTSRAFLEEQYGRMDPVGEAAAQEAVLVAERLGDPDLLSAALDALAWWPSSQGRYGEGYRATRRRIELVPRLTKLYEIGDSYTLGAWNACRLGLYAEAIEHATAVERWPEMEPAALEHALTWRLCARFMSGDWDGALTDQQQIDRFMQEDPRGLPIHGQIRSCCVTAFLHELRGDRAKSERYMKLVRSTLDPGALPPQRTGDIAFLARTLAYQGNADEARDLLPLAERNMSSGALLETLCDVVAEQRDWDAGQAILVRAREEAADCELLALPFFADRLEGRMRSDPDRLRRSAEGFASLGAPWEEALSRLLLAELTGDHEEASRAFPVFERLGSVQEIERARELLATRRATSSGP